MKEDNYILVFESRREPWLHRALRQVSDRFSGTCGEELQFQKLRLYNVQKR